MRVTYKIALVALIAALIVSTAAADCTAPKSASDLPYSVKYTTTGDDKSTTFIMTVCSSKCSPGGNCRPLKGISVGASGVSTTPSSSTDSCGTAFSGSSLGSLASQAPSEPSHCQDFYLIAKKAGASLSDVCPDGCPVVFELDNGVRASTGVDGPTPSPTNPPPSPATPSPSTPSSPSVSSSPSSGSSSSSSGSSGSGISKPTKYGPTSYGRRRVLSVGEGSVSGFGIRTLQQYGRRRLTQYGRRF